MAFAKIDIKPSPGKELKSAKLSTASLRDNWVFLSNEGADISTLETRHLFTSPSNSRKRRSQDPDTPPRSVAHGGVEGSWTQTSAGASNPNAFIDHAKAFLQELRIVSSRYQQGRRQYSNCAALVNSSTLHLASAWTTRDQNPAPSLQGEAEALQQRVESLNEASVVLDGIEARLLSLEKEFDGIGKNLMFEPGLGIIRGLGDPEIESNAGSEAITELSDHSSDAPSVIEDYFDKAREVFVWKERLEELQQEYQDRSTQVQHEHRQNDTSHSLMSETMEQYDSQRRKLLEALALAESHLACFREACIRQGIEPELVRYRRISEPDEQPHGIVAEYHNTLTAPSRTVRNAFGSVTVNRTEMPSL